MKLKTLVCIGLMVLGVGCSNDDPRLEGKREMLDGSVLVKNETRFVGENLPPIALAEQRLNNQWTHQGGNAQHSMGHLKLAPDLSLQWSISIGHGDGRRHQITATPVIQSGRIFTLDSRSLVTALDLNGKVIWQKNVSKKYDDKNDASGGGLAVSGEKIFITTGFGTVLALSVDNGEELWAQDLESYGGASHTVDNNLLYISARDGAAWAIDTTNGRIKWQVVGPAVRSGYVGGPGAAISDKYVLFPFGSGDVLAIFKQGGMRSWSSLLTGARLGRAWAQVQDMTGQPVVEGAMVYLANSAGRMAAVDLNTGLRIWTSKQGSQGDIFVAGSSVFAVSDESNLIRVSKDNGGLLWATPLPNFTKTNLKRRAKVFAHYGPILAGGRLVITSSDGKLRQFNPVNGALVSSLEMPSGAASAPIVVDGTLYVLSMNGDLLAFR